MEQVYNVARDSSEPGNTGGGALPCTARELATGCDLQLTSGILTACSVVHVYEHLHSHQCPQRQCQNS